jgi:acyl transferase domain-containing protein
VRPVQPSDTDDFAGAVAAGAVAIVGMAGRFPGAASVDVLWRNLMAGRESLERFDEARLAAAHVSPTEYLDPRYVPVAGVVDGVELFDAELFGYSPREATIIDPQQRLLLECAWDALQHAGRRGAGERIGVFAGTGLNGYLRHHVLTAPGIEQALGLLAVALGNEKDHAASRIAYKLDLRGPAVAVQTACSTSLVAVHLACQSLLRDECDSALAGGASVVLPQESGYRYEDHGVMSPDGRCRAFDRNANGTGSGNGVGLVVLRRAADAIAERDTIYALIRGTAINNDGARKVGYTAPSIQGQTEVIRQALRAAGVSADSIGYVEAHGTGTELGDAIEIAALTDAFRQDTERRGFCRVGSVKPNIGHLDVAAGVTALIKAASALHREAIPPSINCAQPNPDLQLGSSPFTINTEPRSWPRTTTPRRCGVSCFGMGGTNAHVVLEEAPVPVAVADRTAPHLIPLTAHRADTLREVRDRLVAHLAADPTVDISDVGHTLRHGRAPLAYRMAVVAVDRGDLDRKLRGATVRTAAPPRTVAFLFPGQGTQRPGMAAGLYGAFELFRSIVDECAERFAATLGLDLRTVLCADPVSAADDDSLLTRTDVAQPALFTVEYALARQLIEWGIRPTVLLGHSIGEYAAACLAGGFSLAEAVDLVGARGRVMSRAPAGAMLTVMAPPATVSGYLSGELSIAAENAPNAVVVAGPPEGIRHLAARFAEVGIPHKRLRVAHAFHTSAMDPVLDEFRRKLATASARPIQTRLVSNVSGEVVGRGTRLSPQYWADQLRRPVRFSAGLARILEMPRPLLVEVGPGRTLTTLTQQHAPAEEVGTVPTMPEPGGVVAVGDLLQAVGNLWARGVPVELANVDSGTRGRRTPLPGYPFRRKRFWIDAAGLKSPSTPHVETVEAAETAETGETGETVGGAPPAAANPPGSKIVAELEQIWRELLGVDEVRTESNFFGMGGHSLLAVRLLSRIRTRLGVALEMRTVLDGPTFGAVVRAVLDAPSDRKTPVG